MTTKSTVEEYLRLEPKFRERTNKDRGIANLLMRRYAGLKRAIDEGLVSKETIIAIVQDYASMDRYWRLALRGNENLRGSDYHDKDKLEQEHEIELGYIPGYNQDIKKLKHITHAPTPLL